LCPDAAAIEPSRSANMLGEREEEEEDDDDDEEEYRAIKFLESRYFLLTVVSRIPEPPEAKLTP